MQDVEGNADTNNLSSELLRQRFYWPIFNLILGAVFFLAAGFLCIIKLCITAYAINSGLYYNDVFQNSLLANTSFIVVFVLLGLGLMILGAIQSKK